MRRIGISTATAAVLVAAAIVAAHGGAAGAPAGATSNPVRADAGSAAGFSPRTVTAKPGARVHFRNVDHLEHNAVHDVVSGRPKFRSGRPTTRSFSFVAPAAPGRYSYRCRVHGFMRGTLVVKR